jgi:hypothetical protein
MAEESLEIVLCELDNLLSEETKALGVLDYEEIERIAGEKTELLRRLSKADRAGVSKETLRRTAMVRQKALHNQLLMVHARDLIRGVLDAWEPPAYDGRGTAPPRLLAMRG